MFTQQEFANRRLNLMKQMAPNSMAIIASAKEVTRNSDCPYRFRQDSNFYYLTGFNEPEAVVVLLPHAEHGQYLLFNRERDRAQEIWHGLRAGQQGAIDNYAADASYPISQFITMLPELMQGVEHVYYPFARQSPLDDQVLAGIQQIRDKIRGGVQAPTKLHNLDGLLDEMRLIKSEQEIDVMREVASLSANAHKDVMQNIKTMHNEYQVEARLLYQFHDKGCRAPAYEPIVGGGANACILHYTENNAPLNEGELLLIDAGGELNYYAADITRTFPINGQFSPAQKSIYEVVLRAQRAGIECIRPGLFWNEIQLIMVEVITRGLLELGILSGDLQHLIDTQAYRAFYMHNSGHWLGLDTHDVGQYKQNGQWRKLQPGMVLTVEPGIYIAQDTQGVDSKWWNIGIRIEDDILVTPEGHENLTHAVPKEIDEIEALMR